MIITSRDLIPIEENFKVEAGPGAGKTDFVVNHIKNVVRNSTRLSSTRKVACITYTNTGVNTILHRLGKSISERVEVSTIHSFLYKNIVKPYSSFIDKEYDVNCKLIAGHDDFTVNRKSLEEWLNNDHFENLESPNKKNQLLKWPEQFAALKEWVTSMQCSLEKGNIFFKCDSSKSRYQTDSGNTVTFKKNNLSLLSEHLIDLKKIYWRKGKIDHNDVLFFSMILIKKYPFILEIIRAKFPYIFLDEYQDTSPIQAYIVNRIKERETVIGVIGDKAQSIYSFQGANPSLFDEFKVNPNNEFSIVENHRSSDEIVSFLNSLRSDIQQKMCAGKNGNKVCIIVGERVSAYHKAFELCEHECIESLSRDNMTSNAMKKNIGNTLIKTDILAEYEKKDSNHDRRRYVMETIQATELAINGKFKEAIKHLEHVLPKQQTLKALAILLTQYSSYSDKTLLNFYEQVKPLSTDKLSGITKGEVKKFYENNTYQNIAICTNIPEDTSEHITIHKSKGNQFKNVFVVGYRDVKKFLLKPSLDNENHRIAYVAFSRANDRLFIQFENAEISADEEKVLKSNFDMIQIIHV